MEMKARELPELAVPIVAHQPEYVIGYPVHVALTIRLDDASGVDSLTAVLAEESVYRIRGTEASLQRLDDPREPPILAAPPQTFGHRESTLTLRAGERMRMLLDLSDLDLSAVRPGRYRVSLRYEGLATAPFEVSFRDPTPEEQAVLTRLRPEKERAGSWGLWSRTPPLGGDAPALHIDRSDPLRYNRVIRYLLFGPGELPRVPDTLLSPLDAFYAPEAFLLHAELAHARGGDAFAIEERELRLRHPEMVYLLDRTIAHGSLYAWEREINRNLGIWP